MSANGLPSNANTSSNDLSHRQSESVNVGQAERIVSIIGGALLIAGGIKRRSLLGGGMAVVGAGLIKRGLTGHCEGYEKLHVSTASEADNKPYKKAIKVERSITVGKPVEELYAFWRDFANLPKIMQHLESVNVIDEKRSHWIAKAPLDHSVEWDAQIINEIRNELIAWESLEGADVYNSGSVHFRPAPGDRGTEIKVVIRYTPPAGKLGAFVAKILGEDPSIQVGDDLRRFKQLMETGEVTSTVGQPTGVGRNQKAFETPISMGSRKRVA